MICLTVWGFSERVCHNFLSLFCIICVPTPKITYLIAFDRICSGWVSDRSCCDQTHHKKNIKSERSHAQNKCQFNLCWGLSFLSHNFALIYWLWNSKTIWIEIVGVLGLSNNSESQSTLLSSSSLSW